MSRSLDPKYGELEDHQVINGETPRCAQGWCCGCPTHPIAKPWGWNQESWERHYADYHKQNDKTEKQ